MKRNYFYHPVILLTFILSIFIPSCSKEKNSITVPAGQETMDASASRIARWGSVTGLVLPRWSDVKIIVYNRNFSSTDFYYKKNGSFQADRIPAGIYTVTVMDITTLIEYSIPDIKVGAGTIIDIGTITLR